jgi:hypothetical protein
LFADGCRAKRSAVAVKNPRSRAARWWLIAAAHTCFLRVSLQTRKIFKPGRETSEHPERGSKT